MAPITRSSARRARDASRSDKPSRRRPNELVTTSQIPYSPPIIRRCIRRTASQIPYYASDRLPADMLSDILQLFPAKDLCRLRTVCRSWRSIISNPNFIREHADSHKEPLLVVTFPYDKKHVYVLDLNGNVVKRVSMPNGGLQVLRTRLEDFVCLATEWNKCCLLNPATGGIHQVLPQLVASGRVIPRKVYTFLLLGLVASRNEYKLLCCLITFNNLFGWELLTAGVQVLTINGGTDHALWRRRPDPPLSIDVRSGVVVDGMVYFLTSSAADMAVAHFQDGVPADCILSFDFAREEWRPILHGPSGTMGYNLSGPMVTYELSLADLKGSLVLAHHPCRLSIMDLWFLLDFESMLWEKQYNIQTESVTRSTYDYKIIPLLALDDGRLVILLVAPFGCYEAPGGNYLFICDPGTNTFTGLNTRDPVDSVGVYTGSLLSLQEGPLV